jgi:hypothetical protein
MCEPGSMWCRILPMVTCNMLGGEAPVQVTTEARKLSERAANIFTQVASLSHLAHATPEHDRRSHVHWGRRMYPPHTIPWALCPTHERLIFCY